MELIHTLIALLVLIVVTVVPVMIAARWAGARRRGFLPALGAVVLATLAAQLALHLVAAPLPGLILAFVLACAAYALVLGTPFVAAVGIAVVAMVLQVVIVAALVWLGLHLPVTVTLGTTV